MAVKVIPARGMSAPTPRMFEAGTTYKFDGGRLDVYQGNKRIGTYAPGCWESVEVLTLLDAPRLSDGDEGSGTRGDGPRLAGARIDAALARTKQTAQQRLDDAKAAKKAEPAPVKKKAKKAGGSRVTRREGASIRTSPLRGDKL